jgi:hypothetical protein
MVDGVAGARQVQASRDDDRPVEPGGELVGPLKMPGTVQRSDGADFAAL